MSQIVDPVDSRPHVGRRDSEHPNPSPQTMDSCHGSQTIVYGPSMLT